MLAVFAGGGLAAGAALFAGVRQPPVAQLEPPCPAERMLPLDLPLPVETAPTAKASPPVPTGGLPAMPRETKVEAEMAKVRRLLEKHAKMTDPRELRAVESELRAARERIARLPR